MKLSHLQKIDSILSAMHSRQAATNKPMSYNEIMEENKSLGLSELDLTNILQKLEDDKYVFVDRKPLITATNPHGQIPLNHKCYSITFTGQIFDLEGGYITKRRNDVAENIRLDNIEHAQKSFRRTQNVLLFLASVGTLIAAWYYLMYLNKDFYHWWYYHPA